MNSLECPHGGSLLLGAFPGLDAYGADPRANVVRGLKAFRDAGASMLITLVENQSLARHGLEDYGDLVRDAHLVWLHLPIADFGVPAEAFLMRWRERGGEVHDRLDKGETIGIHCRAGIGRTGTVAAMILVERGLKPAEAIARVRNARPGAVETQAQQSFVYDVPTAPKR
ncbi:MAG: protein-tyrosine phosphatase family protein [Beijerinckiaceae bacterium]